MRQWSECLESLLNGNLDSWPEHHVIRTGKPGCDDPTPTYGKPVWDGSTEPITLLVNADFGMGDTIQFFRFIPEAKKRVSRLVLRCDEDFRRFFSGVEVVSKDDPLPEFDKVIHMMALPNVLSINRDLISGRSYLERPSFFTPLSSTLKMGQYCKIGVCWSGNPFNPRDSVRSIPVELFQKLILVNGMFLVSLNKIHASPDNHIWDCRGSLGDWAGTAAVVSALDLVVTVDTAVAHLAGALGVPVWLLITNEDPDWRWGRSGHTTVWYDSMRIFRKQSDWDECLDRVREKLISILFAPEEPCFLFD